LGSGLSRQSSRPWVVKLGGSLQGSPNLRRWLNVIAATAAPVVIVPGGGPFADVVRLAQKRLRFCDAVAHHMALLAMEQYGRAIAGMAPSMRTEETLRSIKACLERRQAAIWLPARMVLGRSDIAESWDVTSDSLALWLSWRLKARGLFLVKSARLAKGPRSAAELSRREIIDAAFPRMLAAHPCPSWCIESRNHRLAAEAFRTGAAPLATNILPA
jgi:5-(aminomethyl)-3-furanmethanol phosphate kinase